MKRGRSSNRICCLCTWRPLACCYVGPMRIGICIAAQNESGSCAIGIGAAHALLHRRKRHMRHPRSHNLVHSKKPKCIHNSRFRIVAWYHSSSTAAHSPHSQLLVKWVALPAPGRSPLNSPEEHLPFNHTNVQSPEEHLPFNHIDVRSKFSR